MFHNTLVVGSSIRKPGKSSKTAKRPAIWIGVRPGELVGHQPCSITLWWLVRVRPAPPPSRIQPEKSCFEKSLAQDVAGSCRFAAPADPNIRKRYLELGQEIPSPEQQSPEALGSF